MDFSRKNSITLLLKISTKFKTLPPLPLREKYRWESRGYICQKMKEKTKQNKKNGLMERSRKFLEIPFERKLKGSLIKN